MKKQSENIFEEAMPKVSRGSIQEYESLHCTEKIFQELFQTNKYLYAYYDFAVKEMRNKGVYKDAKIMSDILLGIFHMINLETHTPKISRDTCDSFAAQSLRGHYEHSLQSMADENKELYTWLMYKCSDYAPQEQGKQDSFYRHAGEFYNLIRAQNEVNELEKLTQKLR